MRRNLNIATVTAAALLPVVGISQTVNIDNGTAGAGHLDVNIDAYGAYGNWNAAYFDTYEPNAGGPSNPTFSAGFRVFSGNNKTLLTDMPEWHGAVPGSNWGRTITTPVFNVNAFTASSAFELSSSPFGIPDLTFTLRQVVSSAGGGIAHLDQFYTVTNVSGGAMNVEMNRVLDGDLVWGTPFDDDHVGHSGNAVYMREPGNPDQSMSLTSLPGGLPHNFYWGGKNTHVPTGGGPAFGFGSDTIVFNNNGLPTTWEDYVAYVGYGVDGDSGLVVGQDGHIGLDWRLSLPDNGSASFNVRTTYGAIPEPASMIALGTGLVLLLRRRRRKPA